MQQIYHSVPQHNLWCWGVALDYTLEQQLLDKGLKQVIISDLSLGREGLNCVLIASDGRPFCWRFDIGAPAAHVYQESDLSFMKIGAADGFACGLFPPGVLEADFPNVFCWTVGNAAADPPGTFTPYLPAANYTVVRCYPETCLFIDGVTNTVGCQTTQGGNNPQHICQRINQFLLPFPIIDVAIGNDHVCVIYGGVGQVQCFGSNLVGEGSPPISPLGFGSLPFTHITATDYATCGVEMYANTVNCWGLMDPPSVPYGVQQPMPGTFTCGGYRACDTAVNHSIAGPAAPSPVTVAGNIGACMNGTFSVSVGGVTSLCSGLCDAGFFGSGIQSNSACAGECPPGSFCPAGSAQPLPCPVMTASPNSGASVCQQCSVNSHAVLSGSVNCLACPSTGVECFGGSVSVSTNYWAMIDAGSGQLLTLRCPPGYCSGSPIVSNTTLTAEVDGSAMSGLVLSNPCSANRDSASPFCRSCSEGYVEWLGNCVECDSTRQGLVALVVFIAIGYVAVLHLLSQYDKNTRTTAVDDSEKNSKEIAASTSSSEAASSASRPADATVSTHTATTGSIAAATWFIQSALLQSGSASSYTAWLGLVSLQPHQSSGSTCLAPLSAFEMMALNLIVPMLFFACLVTAAVTHIAALVGREEWRKRRTHSPDKHQPEEAMRVKASEARSGVRVAVAHWSSADLCDYCRTFVVLLLFAYQQVGQYSLSYFNCVRVGGVTLVYQFPNIDCNSSEYKEFLPFVILLFIAFNILLPAGAFVLLWKRRSRMGMEQQHGRQQQAAADSDPALDRWVGVLYDSFCSSCWWFSFFILALRLLAVCLDTFLASAAALRSMSFGLVNVAFICVQVLARPYRDGLVNQLQMAAGVTLVIISLIETATFTDVDHVPTAAQVVVSLLILIPAGVYALVIAKEVAVKIRAKAKNSSCCRGKLDTQDQHATAPPSSVQSPDPPPIMMQPISALAATSDSNAHSAANFERELMAAHSSRSDD